MTNRQANLLSKARQKLSASRDLLRQGHPEDAVSRAYYVMFYAAEALLDGEGLRFSSHAGVISAFGRLFAKTGRVSAEFHRYLKEAQEDRTGADYGETYSVSPEEAEDHVQKAGRFLELAENLIQAPEPGDSPTLRTS